MPYVSRKLEKIMYWFFRVKVNVYLVQKNEHREKHKVEECVNF